jgi:Subtilase family
MAAAAKIVSRNYFLNEKHELSTVDKSGGGRPPSYADIPWATKAKRISESIQGVVKSVKESRDPLREERYFVVAKPMIEVEKKSKNLVKAPTGTFMEPTSFGGTHGRTFDRLGLDLIQVSPDGDAVVHGTQERMDQLLARSKTLDTLGVREQARWVTIDQFETIPLQLRVDGEWLDGLDKTGLSEVVFELQPVLGRVDVERVLRAVTDILSMNSRGRLSSTGTDFSGRSWFSGKAQHQAILDIAREFFSVQSIHSPLFSVPMANAKGRKHVSEVRNFEHAVPDDARELPCVAVIDLGVPADHLQLAPYRRGQFTPQGAAFNPSLDHGSFVASRAVFGEHEDVSKFENSAGTCSFYDVIVGEGYGDRINDKVIIEALRGVRGAAPDVRVFNLSIGTHVPLGEYGAVEQREKRLELQDLDNFAFANDVLFVVAAGNSPKGIPPVVDYPNHYSDPRWALGAWACGFNTMVCGSYVSALSSTALVKTIGYPSPFSRVGYGLVGAPVPTFCAEGGNASAQYNFESGLGVWGYTGSGLAEDRVGTSYAAPILAREAALAFAELQKFCPQNTLPFAVTVRAFLALTAEKTTTDVQVQTLVERTLGLGKTSAARLSNPSSGSALILWQGIIETSKDVVRVQLPIPRSWLQEAADPTLRFFLCYDPPVNEAATATWACRKVTATLHKDPEADALRGSKRKHETYPLLSREYKLKKHVEGERAVSGDVWLIELKYDEIFDYPAGMEFDPRQRVAIAAELIDLGATGVDPQPAMQALDIAASMNRLSTQITTLRNPVIIRSRAR